VTALALTLDPTAAHTRRSLLATSTVAALALLALVMFWRPVVQAVLPLQAWMMQSFTNDFRVLSLSLQRQGLDEAVSVRLAVPRTMKRQDGSWATLPPQATIDSSVSAAKSVLPLACVLLVLVMWPVSDRREYGVRAVAGLLAALVMLALDFPVVLLGLAWGSLHDAVPGLPTSHAESFARFLESGGRFCLALSASLLVVVGARWLVDGWPERVRRW
jgi:hypothetical protein